MTDGSLIRNDLYESPKFVGHYVLIFSTFFYMDFHSNIYNIQSNLTFIYVFIYYCSLNTTEMSDLKIINTGQGYVHKYVNLKRKLYNSDAYVYFNKKFLKKIAVLNCILCIFVYYCS